MDIWMDRFLVKKVNDGEIFVLNVDHGKLRLRGGVQGTVGSLVFAVSNKAETPGTYVKEKNDEHTEVLHIVCQSPEKAENIAKAFIDLANMMRTV